MRTATGAAPCSSSTTSRRSPRCVSRYLERAGYETRVAADGPQALELAGARRPDLVVLDLMLPGIDGLEVMRRLRAFDGQPRPRVPSSC